MDSHTCRDAPDSRPTEDLHGEIGISFDFDFNKKKRSTIQDKRYPSICQVV